MGQIAGLAASPFDEGQVAGQDGIQFVNQRLYFRRELSHQRSLSALFQAGKFIAQTVQGAQSDHHLGDCGNRQTTGEKRKCEKQGIAESGNRLGQQVFICGDNQADRFARRIFRTQDPLDHQEFLAIGATNAVFVLFSVGRAIRWHMQDKIP